tara:strand:- start:217 stop:2589 length:2373 start_codon:yes stop_codon:yes gene_type:complete
MKSTTIKYPKNKSLLGLIILVFLMILGTNESAAQTGTDLATNGSFAEFELGELLEGDLGWTFNINGGDPMALAYFDIVDDAQDGDGKALKIDIGPFNDGSDWNVEAVNENLAVKAGVTYKASVWIKADSTIRTARLYFGLPESGNYARYMQTDFEVTKEWEEYTLEYTATAIDEQNQMRFATSVNLPENEDGIFYIDNFTFIGIDSVDTQNADSSIVNVNGGFESSNPSESTSGTVNWSFSVASTSTANFALVEDNVKDGSLALKVNVETLSENSYDIQATNTGFEVEPDVDYTYSIWAKSSGEATASFTIGNAEFTEFGRLDQQVLTTEWQEYTMQFSVGPENVQLRAPIHLGYAGNDSVDIWIDELVIRRTDSIKRPIAYGRTKFLGNIYSSAQIPRFNEYWNQVTPENAGKWGSVEGTRDVMNWGGLDAAYALAKDNGFPFRFHILIWGGQQPGWINDLEPAEQLEEIEEWMDAVAARYPDMEYVEVVNEGSNGHQLPDGSAEGRADYIDALGGTGETGFDWIITSFEMARERFPNSKLMINDYNIVSSNTWNTQNALNYKEIIDELNERGLIDVIGVQAHAFSTVGTAAQIKSVLDLLAETGLPIQATEMDIDGNPNGDSDAEQLSNIQRIFPAFWEHPAVEGVTLWGWRPGLWRNDQEAFIMRNGDVERPALTWLREYVTTSEVGVSNEDEGDDNSAPSEFKLSQNYPNPFNPSTQIEYQVSSNSNVSINVYDITGRLVQTLVNKTHSAGSYTVNFNASALSTGMYFYELRSDTYREIKKMMLIK